MPGRFLGLLLGLGVAVLPAVARANPPAYFLTFEAGAADGRELRGQLNRLQSDALAGATYYIQHAIPLSCMSLRQSRGFIFGCNYIEQIVDPINERVRANSRDYITGLGSTFPNYFQLSAIPQTTSAVAQAPARPLQAPEQPQTVAGANDRFTKLLDSVVATDAKSWATNFYNRGSMRSVAVTPAGNNLSVRGIYTYDDNKSGWVEAMFSNGHVSCVRYWDYPDECRRVGQGNGKQLEALSAAMAREQRLHPSRPTGSASNTNRDNCTLADHLYAPGAMGPFAGGMYLGNGCN